MKRKALICGLLLTVTILTATLLTALRQTRAQVPSTGALAERARETGTYITYLSPNEMPRYADVETLTRLSTTVVVGVAGANVVRLSANGNFITTDFQVRVQEVLKGRVEPGSVLTVSLPGGMVTFYGRQIGDPNPYFRPPEIEPTEVETTTAEIRVPWFKKMEPDRQYVLFLTGAEPTSNSLGQLEFGPFQTTGGPQGVFEVSNGVVLSNSGRLRDPIWQYHRMPLNFFLPMIRAAAHIDLECINCSR